MERVVATIVVVVLAVAATASVVIAQQSPATGREALAQALKGAWLPLESGLIVGSTQGTPLSAKYEIDDGAFQLSVYTVKTDANAARDQQVAVAVAKRTLDTATASVVKAHAGYRAVSVMPAMNHGRPVAEILLLNGTAWKVVSEPLD